MALSFGAIPSSNSTQTIAARMGLGHSRLGENGSTWFNPEARIVASPQPPTNRHLRRAALAAGGRFSLCRLFDPAIKKKILEIASRLCSVRHQHNPNGYTHTAMSFEFEIPDDSPLVPIRDWRPEDLIRFSWRAAEGIDKETLARLSAIQVEVVEALLRRAGSQGGGRVLHQRSDLFRRGIRSALAASCPLAGHDHAGTAPGQSRRVVLHVFHLRTPQRQSGRCHHRRAVAQCPPQAAQEARGAACRPAATAATGDGETFPRRRADPAGAGCGRRCPRLRPRHARDDDRGCRRAFGPGHRPARHGRDRPGAIFRWRRRFPTPTVRRQRPFRPSTVPRKIRSRVFCSLPNFSWRTAGSRRPWRSSRSSNAGRGSRRGRREN